MRKRVLMVMESIFPSKGGGGAESQVRTLGLHLPAQGVDVSVLVPMVSRGPQKVFDSVDGVAVQRIRYPKVPSLGAILMLGKLAWHLFRRRKDYDFIHGHIAGNMSAVCCLMGRLLGKPVLIKLTGLTEMVGGILDDKAGPRVWVKRAMMRSATYYQATSLQIARMLGEQGFDPAKVQHIPNAVDTDRFARVTRDEQRRRELCGGDKRLVAIYVGRLEREKDLELMLNGWAAVFKGNPEVSLILVGSGALASELAAQAKQLGIDDQVVFAGASNSVESFLPLADFGLLTSRAEGLSNTLLEYMASSLPVIGTRVSGTEDFVVNDQTGWLFPVSDQTQLEQCLRKADQAGPEGLKSMGGNARRLVVAKASIAAVVTRLVELYSTAPLA